MRRRCATSSLFRRRPNSRAAMILIALASPIPSNSLINSPTESLLKLLRLPPTRFKIRWDNSTAVSRLFPEPMSIATNSADDKARVPFNMSFSRGRSSSAQSVITIFSFFSISVKKISGKITIFSRFGDIPSTKSVTDTAEINPR